MNSELNSDKAKKGYLRSPHRSLLKAAGYTDWEIERPWIGVANAYNAIIPGHVHLRTITEAVKAGIYAAGGLPIEFPVIGVCDGIAMNHEGMKFSLPSRELIMDSVEIMTRAHALDGLVLVPNCDKIIPGMAMAAAELNLPALVISGGPMMGISMRSIDVPVVKGTSGILALTAKSAMLKPITPCLRCGRCVTACPMGLVPNVLEPLVLERLYTRFEEEGGMNCIECGSCTYMCPANRPLTQGCRDGKASVMAMRRKAAAK